MDIYLSGDIRKDKTSNGYILNPKYYPNNLYLSGTSAIGSGAQYYNIILDSFDYSGNFIDRKSSSYNRGTTGGGAGIDISWDNIGYLYNLYISGSSTQFIGFSGVTTTSNSYDYSTSNQYKFTIDNLPNYSGLTVTTASTLFGNVLIKLNENHSIYNNTFNYELSAMNPPFEHIIELSGSGLYNISFEAFGDDDFSIYDGIDQSGELLYSFTSPYFYVLTSGTFNIISGNLFIINFNNNPSTGVTVNNLNIVRQNSGTTKFIKYDVESVNDNFTIDMFKNNERVRTIRGGGVYNNIIDFAGLNENETWINFFIKSTDEVRLNNVKIFLV
jgi:hypothetical protein